MSISSWSLKLQLVLGSVGTFLTVNGQPVATVEKDAARHFARNSLTNITADMLSDVTPYDSKNHQAFAAQWRNTHDAAHMTRDEQKTALYGESRSKIDPQAYYVAASDALNWHWSDSRQDVLRANGLTAKQFKRKNAAQKDRLYAQQDAVEDKKNDADFQTLHAAHEQAHQALIDRLLPADRDAVADATQNQTQPAPQNSVSQEVASQEAAKPTAPTTMFGKVKAALTAGVDAVADSIRFGTQPLLEPAFEMDYNLYAYHPNRDRDTKTQVKFKPGSDRCLDRRFLIDQCVYVGWTRKDAVAFVNMINNREAHGLNVLAHNRSGADTYAQFMPSTERNYEKKLGINLPDTDDQKKSVLGIRAVAYASLHYWHDRRTDIAAKDRKRVRKGKIPLCGQQVIVATTQDIQVENGKTKSGKIKYKTVTKDVFKVVAINNKAFGFTAWAGIGYYNKVAGLLDRYQGRPFELPLFGKKYKNQPFDEYILDTPQKASQRLKNNALSEKLERHPRYRGKMVSANYEMEELPPILANERVAAADASDVKATEAPAETEAKRAEFRSNRDAVMRGSTWIYQASGRTYGAPRPGFAIN